MEYTFQRALPVWGEFAEGKLNQFAGFHAKIRVDHRQEIVMEIGARSYYRLYVNGAFVANGPARTAKGHLRIDVIRVQVEGEADQDRRG